MPWDNDKTDYRPPNWKQLRAQVIQRAGGNCQAPNCIYQGTDVDHIVNVKAGGTHHIDNLQLLCRWHHREKTQAEANTSRPPKPSQWRSKPKHPGYA